MLIFVLCFKLDGNKTPDDRKKYIYKEHLQYSEREQNVKKVFDPSQIFNPCQNFVESHHLHYPRHIFTHATHAKTLWTHATHEPTLLLPLTLFSRLK